MVTQFDDKGKFYTEVIPKEAVQVTIQTLTHRMHGVMYKRQNIRLIDELNLGDDNFIPLTEVTVYNAQGGVLFQTDFIAVEFEHIVWVIPDNELKTSVVKGGAP
jgi:predicted component of type VI protein secretion system